jgi:hypothetical protein
MANWLERHPRINAWLTAIGDAFHYVFTGGWVIDVTRWLIDTGGNIAESAFVLATVYVTINTVAHLLVTWLLPDRIITTLNQISIIAFSVLPELIVVAALAVCFDHWRMVYTTKRVDAWVWAIAYSLPTAVFLGMTIYTITSFVSFEVANTVAVHQMVNGKLVTTLVQTGSFTATGPMLVTRCLAGWTYGTVQMLFVKLGKPGYTNMVNSLQDGLAALGDSLNDRDANITALQSQVATMQQQIETQGRDLVEARLQIATAKVTRNGQSDISKSENTNTNSKVTQFGDSRQKLKRHIRGVVLAGERVNYQQISKDTGISYNTVRRHAGAIIDEIRSERSTDQLEQVTV